MRVRADDIFVGRLTVAHGPLDLRLNARQKLVVGGDDVEAVGIARQLTHFLHVHPVSHRCHQYCDSLQSRESRLLQRCRHVGRAAVGEEKNRVGDL